MAAFPDFSDFSDSEESEFYPKISGFLPTSHAWRPRPAEFERGFGWYQDGYKRRVKKPYYHFIWPKDGRNGSKWGRLKDIMTGKGPDIHVTIGAGKNDHMFHRQRRDTWAGHMNLDDRGPDCSLSAAPWTRKSRDYAANTAYDYKTRKYRRRYDGMWTDAYWPEGNAKLDGYKYPYGFRDVDGNRWQWYSYAGQ
ncbi:hypothetical protein EJ04DRAFT_295073 [Polyplosphaeria fusca]|uniref:Uncharacterized protein n=1 Tax=Polyplosphaeria fusca TaxID=682080 RepID=A0A9P4QY38_9PLEO|nr:hypothetical protein EJ04DRAFT_295073 [Polyplosphaeria fusca]